MALYIDAFPVLLLDMGGTFMFGVDRFGPEQDFAETYRRFGGSNLDPATITAAVNAVLAHMYALLEENAGRLETYPTISEAFLELGYGEQLSLDDIALLSRVITEHEVGTISTAHAETIRRLATTHRLGLISNIWGNQERFEQEFRHGGILDCFEHRIWSSAHRCIKPSPRLFRLALDRFGIGPSEGVYIGNSPRKDVQGAKQVGLSAVWIQSDGVPYDPDCVAPDLILSDISELPDYRESRRSRKEER